MHEGLGIAIGVPASVIRPVRESMRNTATLFPGMLAQISSLPSGVTARFCGPLPELGTMSISVRPPFSAIEYAAMLS